MKKTTIIIIVIIIIILLPLAWYLASPLFVNNTVDETLESGTTNYQGTFKNADSFHQTSGNAKIVQASQTELQLENFKTTNGPDLYVYLSKDLDATEYVNLGELKGNIGNQAYPISSNVNLTDYPYVLIWCKQFSVLFGSAQLE